MSKRKSGGARAVARKHAQREAERNRTSDYGETWAQRYADLGEPPDNAERGHDWLRKVALRVVHEALTDQALPPEQRRRDVMKFVEQASKVLDPAKLSEQLDELEEAYEELKRNAGHVEARENPPPSSRADLT